MKINIAILFILFSRVAIAQIPAIQHFMYDPSFGNAALTASTADVQATAIYRTQWTSLESAPSTAMLSLAYGTQQHKFGLRAITDAFALEAHDQVGVQYAFAHATDKHGVLAAGLRVDAVQHTFSLTGSHPAEAGDPLLSANISQFAIHTQLGAAWYNENGFGGISVTHFPAEDFDGALNAESSLQFQAQGAYRIAMNNTWGCTPGAAYSITNGAPSVLAAQLQFDWKKTLQLAAGFRSGQNYMARIGYVWKEQLIFGYAFDIDTQFSAAGGGHEILLSWKINQLKNK